MTLGLVLMILCKYPIGSKLNCEQALQPERKKQRPVKRGVMGLKGTKFWKYDL